MSIRDGSCPHCFTDLDRGFRGPFCTRCGWASPVPSDPVGNIGHDQVALATDDVAIMLKACAEVLTLSERYHVSMPTLRATVGRVVETMK